MKLIFLIRSTKTRSSSRSISSLYTVESFL